MQIYQYDITIDFNNVSHFGTTTGYSGRVDMYFKIETPTPHILFHSSPHYLTIHGVKLEQNKKAVPTTFASKQPKAEQEVQQTPTHSKGNKANASSKQKKKAGNNKKDDLKKEDQNAKGHVTESIEDSVVQVDASKLTPGKCKLTVAFSSRGAIPLSTDQLTGMFYSKSGDILQTHFEPAFAHCVFPCIDTFEDKAAFNLTLANAPKMSTSGTPYHFVSNMKIERTIEQGKSQTVIFEQTPVMSPYLLCWVIAPFKELTEIYNADGNELPVRVLYLHQPTALQLIAQLTLDTSLRAIPIIEDYFDSKFIDMIPKVDLVLVPEHCFGGMENWGCITLHATESGLNDSNKKKKQEKQDAFVELIIHELAHFFVGNLVSFPIAIKEGLAQYFEKAIGDQIIGRSTPSINMYKDSTSANTIENNKRMTTTSDQQSLKENFSSMFNGLSYDASLNFICDLIRSSGGQEVFKGRMQQMVQEYQYQYLSHEQFMQFILGK